MTARRFTHKEAHSEKGDDLGPFLVQQSSKPPVFYIPKRSPGLASLVDAPPCERTSTQPFMRMPTSSSKDMRTRKQ
jgi:hypothetical protein